MLRHYPMLFFKSLVKSKGAFFINLISLSTCLICTLLIYLWVHREISADKLYEKDRRLFQVMQNLENHEEIQTIVSTPGILADALAAEIPEIENAVSVVHADLFKKREY